MHRFYLPPEQCRTDNLVLDGAEAHHALDVLRLQPRDKVIVLNGAGEEILCEVSVADRRRASLAVLQCRSKPPLPYRVTLAQALPKGKLFESILQKATELGVFEVVPLLSQRVVSHLDEKDRTEKLKKWQAVATEAIKQCGSAWLPRINAPMTPQQCASKAGEWELSLVGSLQPGAQHPRAFFQDFRRRHGRMPVSVCVWVGPEGDFTPEELELIQDSGARPITLGSLVLRTETAAIYSLSILNYELTWRSEE